MIKKTITIQSWNPIEVRGQIIEEYEILVPSEEHLISEGNKLSTIILDENNASINELRWHINGTGQGHYVNQSVVN
ncbi:hypothetical protein [Alkalihalobacillus sp. BA299]|uniref:hypothetical protein n=1 Tax=Alkalihalobacillus sp. BA299 TaxID=2815938 RepID=UPI001ADD17D1|nr:hypothetical protein [Alkalihalobacillus sp. BA299]